jgi:thymidylate synthase (FAD)
MIGKTKAPEKMDMQKVEATHQVTLMAITPNAEDVIERACRTCHLSFHNYDPPGSTEELIKKTIREKHFSVLEHAMATFRIKGGSRVFTDELVRHRLISPSQESQRYINYGKTGGLAVVAPPTIRNSAYYQQFLELSSEAEKLYSEMIAADIPKEDARYILPHGTTSEIVISANLREYRHIVMVRCHPRAHWEIRRICLDMLRILKREVPIVFWDYEIDEDGQCVKIMDEKWRR